MSATGNQNEFDRDVFPAELEEIEARRTSLGLDTETLSGPPATQRGLMGLALSGGGIRSATFSLGIIQSLARHGVLRHVDYLSTVSGGGYIGSCLSSLLNDSRTGTDGANFPLRSETGVVESPALKHLRNSSNYLSPGGLLDTLRLPNLLLRGVLLNLFLFLPYIMFAVFLTEWAYEKGPNWDDLAILVLPLIVIFILMVIAFPFILRWMRSVFDWRRRNAYELLLTIPLLIAFVIIVTIPMLRLTRFAIEHNWPQVIELVGHLAAAELWKILVVIGIVTALFTLAAKASQNVAKLRGKVVLVLIGALGPLIVFSIYLALCLWQIDSPYLPVESVTALNEAAACDAPCLVPEDNQDETPTAGPMTAGQLLTALRKTAEPSFSELVNEFEGRRIELETGATVSCLTGDCDIDVADWRNDKRVWLVKNSTDAQLKCPKYESDEELAQRDNPDHPCFYLTRTSLRSLRIEGALLSLFHSSEDFVFFGVLAGLLIFNLFFLDVNVTAPHGFYRDRLSKAFLFRFDDDQDEVVANDDLELSQLNRPQTVAPYHLINVAMNLQASKDPNLRGRASDFFVFSKRYVGSDRTGYAPSEKMEKHDRHLDLGTAMAISGAAAAPNMGTRKNKALMFVMTLLNIRLGYWLPNPRKVNRKYWYKFIALGSAKSSLVWKEAIGRLHAQGSHVNLSDGGHIENLGVYELLRRRCRFIVAVDSEEDRFMTFPSLVTLERFARIDLGVSIEIDLEDIRKDELGLSRKHWTLAKIHYGDDDIGHLLYIKLSVTGDEPEYIRAYRSQNPRYPHESTADQFFSEAQFEAYRALGEHIGEGLLNDDSIDEIARYKTA